MNYVPFLNRKLDTANPFTSPVRNTLMGLLLLSTQSEWMWLGAVLLGMGLFIFIAEYRDSSNKPKKKKEPSHILTLLDGQPPSKHQKIYHALISNIPNFLILIIFIGYTFSELYQEQYKHFLDCDATGKLNLVSFLDSDSSDSSICHIYMGTSAIVLFSSACFAYIFHLICFSPILFTKERTSLYDIITKMRVTYADTAKPQKILKKIGTIIAYAFSIFALFFILHHIPDEKLNPEFDKFFYARPINVENNVHIALSALNAPKDVTDIYQYGLKIHNKEVSPRPSLKLIKNISSYCSSQVLILENLNCPSSKDIKTEFNNNKLLIQRYMSLFKYTNYNIGNETELQSSTSLISINKILFSHLIQLTKQERGNEAIQIWLNNMAFIHNMMQSDGNLIDKASLSVIYSIGINTLPIILETDPRLITQHKNNILSLIKKDYFHDIWNIEDTWRAEDFWLYMIGIHDMPNNLFLKPNASKNMLFEYSQDMIRISKLPIADLIAESNKIMKKYDAYTHISFTNTYNPIGNLLLAGNISRNSGHLYINAYAITSRQRALILWMEAMERNISSEDMADFLNNSAEDLYDSFTNKPFQWDNKDKSIFFIKKGDDYNNPINLYYTENKTK